MTQPDPKLPALSPQDQTLDAEGLATHGRVASRLPLLPAAGTNRPRCPQVHFVEGSESGNSGQTQSLLRLRLRSAALVLFIGSAAFFLWGSIRTTVDLRGHEHQALLEQQRTILRWCHLTNMLLLAGFTAALWRKCSLCLFTLRQIELGIFGVTTAFFVVAQHFDLLYTALCLKYVPSTVSLWFALIFTYAIYIPNPWRRAAIVIGLMMSAAIGGYAFDVLRYEQIRELTRDHDPYSAMVLMALFGYGASVYGTYLINSLRQEALDAREFGQYRLKRLLGAGGMGEVYLAEHQLLKRPCALKLIRAAKADDPRTLARFEREVQTIATLSHWNTVEIFDYGRTDDGTFYYVMEYLPGLSIADLVDRHGPLSPARTVHLLEQTCEALQEAHGIGLVHRDVKPGNIFAAQRGGVYDVAKLLDFGLVKSSDDLDGVHLTLEGTITGSPLYMSPEQATGETDPDPRSDIYALGAVAYFMLTGRPPFQSDKPMKVLFAHANEAVVPPSRLRPEIPADVEEVVLRCLEKRPAARYQTAAELAQALRECDCRGTWTRDDAAKWWREIKQPSLTESIAAVT